MDEKNVDFLKKLASPTGAVFAQARTHGRRAGRPGTILAVLIGIFLVVGLTYTARAFISGGNLSESLGGASVFTQIKHLIGADDRPLVGEENGRINILLLGIGGKNHDGGQLTDTIMLASVDPAAKTAGLLSIPRDLVADIPGIGWKKINAANAYGAALNPKNKNAGAETAAKTVAGITGLEIHYYVKIDFAGFEKIVDALGGVRVNVPNAFTDTQYPDEANGFAPVTFAQGWQDFDGVEALKYARSRHGAGGEGSDFARARRQQEILKALQARALALSTLLNPNKIITLTDIVGDHVETNMEIWEMLRLFEMARELNKDSVNQVVLSNQTNGFLVSELGPDGAYILRPRRGPTDFSEIQIISASLLSSNPYAALAWKDNPKLPRVAIQNGTTYPGLASRAADEVESLAYPVVSVANASSQDYEKTVIYRVTEKGAETAIPALREKFRANVSDTLPQNITPPNADILIIVGQDRIPNS